MPHKHVFPRTTFAAAAAVPSREFNAIRRLQDIRRTLSSIVSSRDASAERFATPRANVTSGGEAGDASLPADIAGGRFLVAAQRRVEELLRENHRLTLLCVALEESVRELRERQRENDAANVDGKRGPLGVLTTPSPSHRGRSLRTALEDDNATDASHSLLKVSLANRLHDAVRHFVGVALSVFPRFSAVSEFSANADPASEVENARVVLEFVASRLARWERLSRECAEVGTANTILSQTLSDVEMNHHAWHGTLVGIVGRLEGAQRERRQRSDEKNRQLYKMQLQLKSLSRDLSEALSERDHYMSRCEDLERALCHHMEEQTAKRGNMERLRTECEELRAEVETLRSLDSKDATVNRKDEAQEPGMELEIVQLKTLVQSLTDEKNTLQERLDSLTNTFTETKEHAQALKVKNERLEEHVKLQQNTIEAMQQELEDLGHQLSCATAAVTESCDQPAETRQHGFFQPTKFLNFDTGSLPTCDMDVSTAIYALDADVAALSDRDNATGPQSSFFVIGCGIAKELDFFKDLPLTVLDAWKRFLLQIEVGFIDTVFYDAHHAAECAQFFCATLFHAGLIPHMSRMELMAAVTTALCTGYGHPGLSGAFLAAAQDPSAAGIHSGVVVERYCMDALEDILAKEHFCFFRDIEDGKQGGFLDEIRAFLLPPGWHGDVECLVRSSLALVRSGALQLQEKSVRCQFVRLLLLLAKFAFTMRPFSVCEAWSERWFAMLQRQAQLAAERDLYGFDVPQGGGDVADAQLLLIEHTVLPLCGAVVEAFPPLHPCEAALRANYDAWASRSPKRHCANVFNTPFTFLPDFFFASSREKELNKGAVADGMSEQRDKSEGCLSPSRHVDRGLLVVRKDPFLASQRELLCVYEENITLREILETLVAAVENVPDRRISAF